MKTPSMTEVFRIREARFPWEKFPRTTDNPHAPHNPNKSQQQTSPGMNLRYQDEPKASNAGTNPEVPFKVGDRVWFEDTSNRADVGTVKKVGKWKNTGDHWYDIEDDHGALHKAVGHHDGRVQSTTSKQAPKGWTHVAGGPTP